MLTLSDVITTIAEASSELVVSIEGSPEVTQHHYDQYMTAIPTIARRLSQGGEPQPELLRVVGFALISTGASRSGVTAALRALGALS